ncbi:MAG: sensor histidine kinase [Bacteroidota bacterium]|nr:sensor histidine kinase [Bacteroidota bacterium]
MGKKRDHIQKKGSLTSLFESTVKGYALVDTSYKVLALNQKFAELFYRITGLTVKKNTDFLKLIPSGSNEGFISGIKNAFWGHTISEDQNYALAEDVWVKMQFTPYYEDELNREAVLMSITDISTDKQFEKLASGQKHLMTSVFDTGAGIALLTKEGELIKVNNSFCRILGYTHDEIINTNYFDLVFKPDRKISKERHAQFFVEQRSGTNEVRLIHRDGSVLMVLNQTSFLNNFNGNPLLILSIADITERKQAEQELKAREMFYKALLERSADMKVLTSAQGKIIFASHALTKYLGYSADELSGRNAYDFVPLEDFPHLSILIEEVLREPGISVMVQQRIRHKDGNWRYCEGTITNLLHDPNVGTLVANFRDVTEKILSAELLKNSEITLRTIFNSIDIGIVLLNANMEIIQFNAVAANWSKVTFHNDLTTGENFSEYISPDENRQKFRLNFKSVLNNSVFDSEAQYKTPTGSTVWYHIKMSPVVAEDNEVTGVCITASDITVKRLAEIEKEKITQDLIKRNNNLQQFTYIVSHNLRAPTVNIIALTDLLQNYHNLKLSDKSAILDGLKKSSTQLDTVIKDLNYILQIDSNVLTEKREVVYFSELVNDLLIAINHLIKKEEAVIQLDFDEAPGIESIRLYLYSIFYNLITNSLKYRKPDETPVITIRSKKVHGGIELTFSDNGLGIDLGMHGEKVFGLYNRFHLHKEGKGMGLFIVKSQVETLGGKIHVRSELGKETVFVIQLNTGE